LILSTQSQLHDYNLTASEAMDLTFLYTQEEEGKIVQPLADLCHTKKANSFEKVNTGNENKNPQ
jgi:hypothetical protein